MAVAAYNVEHVSVVIDGKPILDNVSFTLEEGASLAVIGPNGAGKSTLLKCLLRLVSSDKGRISLFGVPIENHRRRELARCVGYVPQTGAGYVPYTVQEFVLMARYAYLTPFSHFTDTDREIASNAMEQTEVMPFAQRRMHTLSGGERQKVFIAAALTQQPRVMLLDEATAFLDYRHQVEVLALVEKLRRDTGVAIIAVTHDLNQGVMDFDQALALKNGRTVFLDAPGALLENNRLESIYDTPFRLLRHSESDRPYLFPERGQS